MGGQVAEIPTGKLGEQAEVRSWEMRLSEESPKAFKCFCLFRNMGYKRSIKGCLELHGIDPKKYGSWSRYARLFNWNERAALYDEYVSKEIEKELIAERVERKKRQMEMLNGFDELHTVLDYKIITEQININEVISIIDMNTKEKIEHAVVDEMTNTIIFINPKLERHVVFVNYNAGYTKETFPEELKEALIRIFLYKKNQLNKSINIEENGFEKLPEDIENSLETYKRKRL